MDTFPLWTRFPAGPKLYSNDDDLDFSNLINQQTIGTQHDLKICKELSLSYFQSMVVSGSPQKW